MEIKRATRQGVRPLIGLYSESGCGKTLSSLLLARGFVGPNGRIVMVDTESGRGSLYADVIEGGYDTLQLSGSFAPAMYIDAIKTVEKSGVSIGIIDSISHEWEGLGGVLDMASTIEESSGKKGLHCWNKPKMEHAKMVLCLLQSTIPWIVCMRAKYKSRQTKDQNGKTQIIKDEFTTPIQSEDFIYEMTFHAEILHDHGLHITKPGHPELRKCFDESKPITVEMGAALARWSADPESPKNTPTPSIETLKQTLWKMTDRIHCVPPGCKNKNTMEAGAKILNQYLIDEAIISDTETIHELSAERLSVVVEKLRAKLS
jgi:hypothetical protein